MQTGLVLFAFLADFLLDEDRIPALLILWLDLILLLLLGHIIEVLNLTAQFMKAVLRLRITSFVQLVAVNVNLVLDVRERRGYDRLDHKKDFAEANGVLQDLN